MVFGVNTVTGPLLGATDCLSWRYALINVPVSIAVLTVWQPPSLRWARDVRSSTTLGSWDIAGGHDRFDHGHKLGRNHFTPSGLSDHIGPHRRSGAGLLRGWRPRRCAILPPRPFGSPVFAKRCPVLRGFAMLGD